MRAPTLVLAALVLTACNSQVPDSGAGVGFESYDSYLNARTAPQQPVGAPLSGFTTDGATAAINNAQNGAAPPLLPPVRQTLPPVQSDVRARGNAPAGIIETTSEMDAVNGGAATAGVSDEQDFEAVKARETIESDKARIERNRATYTVDQPGALPQRTGDAGGSAIVAFALATTHAPGTPMYQRSSIRLSSSQAACGRFASPDLAQEAFLANGGPERDRKSLDPDGDGFACSWDPRPFRTALQ